MSGSSSEYIITRPMRELPERMRPREVIERVGVQNAPDEALVAVLLRSGARGLNVMHLAESLLAHYGSLTNIAKAPAAELSKFRGLGPVKSQVLLAGLELGRRITEEATPQQPRIRTPSEAAGLLRETSRTLDGEVFWVLNLDSHNRLKGKPIDVTRGLLDASLVHPREVFRHAIRTSSAAVILAHNHPSGDPSPSAEDIRITRQVVAAGWIVDIPVLDHVVIGHGTGETGFDFCSMREAGVVQFDKSK